MPKNVILIEMLGKAGRLLRAFDKSTGGVRKFGRAVKSEFAALRSAAASLEGKLAGIGISLGVAQFTKQSALLDKKLVQIGQTAGVGKAAVAGLRTELTGMAKKSGQEIDGLADSFNNLIQSGQSWRASQESTRGINIASAITGAKGDVLAGGLTVGATAFNIDLEKSGQALELLDKMVVAGRLGNAELENLAAIFSRVGVNAASANMSFDDTLAFIETLSLVERSPERLATLADSTLRLFTNLRYMAEAQKATGVKFFDEQGQRRDPVAVLKDIRAEYGKLDTEIKKAGFIQKAFGHADLDTIKGLRTLLGGAFLETSEEFKQKINAATGTLNRDYKDATDTLVDQAGRLRETLREAADGFTKPLRETLNQWIKWGLDQKKLSGGQILAGGAGLAVGGLALARYGPRLAGNLLKKFGGDAAGIATGKMVEAATGVQPVFVTNWPDNLGGLHSIDKLAPSALKEGARMGSRLLISVLPLLPAVLAAVGAKFSQAAGEKIAEKQIGMMGTGKLNDLYKRMEVMGGGLQTFQAKQIRAELDRRASMDKTAGMLKTTHLRQDKLMPAHIPTHEFKTEADVLGYLKSFSAEQIRTELNRKASLDKTAETLKATRLHQDKVMPAPIAVHEFNTQADVTGYLKSFSAEQIQAELNRMKTIEQMDDTLKKAAPHQNQMTPGHSPVNIELPVYIDADRNRVTVENNSSDATVKPSLRRGRMN